MKRTPLGIIGGLTVALTMLLSACSGAPNTSNPTSPNEGDFDGCTRVVAAVSPEKVNMFTEMAVKFKESPEGKALDKCATIVPVSVSSGEASRLLKQGWPTDQTTKPQPVIWSPASTTWTADVADSQGQALVPEPQSFATTPVVLAMPERMARALGWPDKPIGLQDIEAICTDPQGWSKFGGGAATWGAFKLGKTTPMTSTTGLNTLLMQAYAASGKTTGLTPEDVANSRKLTEQLEKCVIHYGDTTGSMLQRVYDRDQNGQSLGYVSAVAVEETSVINYNAGNPTSAVVDPATKLTPPREKLVAVYPSGGSLVSDNPVVVLGTQAPWVNDEQRTAAQAFKKFVMTDAAQSILGNYGFRPADPKAKPTGKVSAEFGANPDLPTVILEKPSVASTAAVVQLWNEVRKPSSVLVLMDVSGSMADPSGSGNSRMTDAIEGAVSTLGHFRPTDELGVWVFSTGLSSPAGENIAVVRDVKPLGGEAEILGNHLRQLAPVQGTPLYDSIGVAFKHMYERADTGRINAIVVLTDGQDTNSRIDLDSLKRALRAPDESNDPLQVRVFPIVYGEASPQALTEIAVASGGQVFDASDPRRLTLVFQSVMNNF